MKEVKNYVDAVPGKELYDTLFGPDKVHDEAEFDAALTEKMTEEFRQESDYRFMLDAREYLMNKADIKVSEDFLKRWLYQVNEGKFSKEDIDKAMYGLNNVPEEHLKGYAANILADDKQGRRIAEKAQENVVLAFVRKTVTIDNKEISSAELRKMNE